MSRLGFNKSVVVYHGEVRLGELDTIPVRDQNFQFPNSEIRIHHISLQSERCPPLAILQTISSFSVRCKLESSFPTEQPHLINLHASCFYESKTAVVVLGDEEIHLVAMPSKQKKFPCFWCFAVPLGLYDSCLALLSLRCLAIVFDLDETLIVANTMKSFEDRIEALRAWISREMDQVRVAGMVAEMRRYMDDRMLLKQYTDTDCVVDNGKTYKAQLEEVPALSDTHERIIRPVIRLPDKNLVLTRINPEIRDTSVVVRLRPAWEDLRSYLTAKGRKRFEVYVCTMAERDYALEMWRLLDPGSHLITLKQLFNRVVCVKSGARKSLLNVFRDRACHPRMAMVIDDRSNVWEDKDQPRVHVVPAFTPYYAPQAETANAVPVLCVARNVACNVRGCFFKEFDEHLIRKITEVFYEDEVISLPPVPDVSSYMMTEEKGPLPNGNANAPISEGMSGSEVERRLHQSDERSIMDSTTHSVTNTLDLRSEVSVAPIATVPTVVGLTTSTALVPPQKSILFGASVTRDLSNQNPGQAPLLSRAPAQMLSSIPPQGGWFVDGDASRAHPNNRPSIIQDCDPLKSDKMRGISNPFVHNTPSSTPTGSVPHASGLKGDEAFSGADLQKQNHPTGIQPPEVGVSQNVMSSSGKEFQTEAGKLNMLPSHLCISVLQEIGRRCNAKVEFKSVVSTSKDLQFSVEVSFTGEKIGVGMGKTRKDAQQQAAENALHKLAEKYVAQAVPYSGAADRDFDKLSLGDENGFLWDDVNSGSSEAVQEDGLERMPEATEVEPASSLVKQQQQKRAGSPRLPQSVPSKWAKEDQSHSTKSLPSRKQKNGHHVS